MKQEFKTYLTENNISKTLLDTLIKKYEIMRTASGVKEFDDIFLSEGMSNLGTREYFSLWGFHEKIMCKISISKVDLMIYRMSSHLSSANFDDRNYDLSNPNNNSKLHISIRRVDADGLIGLSASGLNCSQLMTIYKKYFLPNITE